MHVRDLVARQQVITVGPQDEVASAVRLLFAHNIGGMPVVASDGSVVGFIGERDIVKTMNSHLGPIRNMLVRDAMRPAAVNVRFGHREQSYANIPLPFPCLIQLVRSIQLLGCPKVHE